VPPPGGGRAAQREGGALSAAGAPAVAVGGWRARLAAAWDGDVAWSFRHSPVALASALVLAACLAGSLLAPWIAPHNPFDLRTLDLQDALLPPIWQAGGQLRYALGTDDQGRDVLSAIMFGARISLLVGLASVALAVVTGVALGLVAGYVGGRLDAFIMRVADVQLSFPAILIALLIDGVARAALPRDVHADVALLVLVLAIGMSNWVQYARTVRGSTMVEKNKEYVQAARVIGLSPLAVMRRHLLPNVVGPVLVLATINIATAIITEATLSFLGVGVPSTQPSLGTLIRVGNDFLFSGEWWITIFPGAALVIMVLSINLLGDWLRDALNPRLR
jgi:peptide/nickel transport system permease protein